MSAKSGLLGPVPLTAEAIAQAIPPLSIGAFAVGRMRGGRFYIRMVGRADRDLAAALADLIGQGGAGGPYDAFKYRTYVSTRRAYEKECQLFHTFAPPDSATHPVRPKGTRFTCPVASCPESA